ncbi:guanylate-binding protein 2-like [Megalops cyprinoides]|uniref:guanylate-binding protein 2-like n=1 Tax=Megalops cyprinoides TaxID=118141 RepID=UPI00186473C7|nr:guanylate-binding protein 2-like [Megalops cyprinoides]
MTVPQCTDYKDKGSSVKMSWPVCPNENETLSKLQVNLQGDKRNDTWIFALAVLLSSTLVYNSMGTINHEAVMSLQYPSIPPVRAEISYVHELAKHIKVKSSDNGETAASVEFIRIFPHFVWVVRDFMLQLELDGKTITADEYLENALKNIVVSDSNNSRKCIQKYFPSQKCFVFDVPASKEKLKIIEELSDEDLHPEFVKQTSEFCNYIIEHSYVKTIKGETKVTGSMFGNLAKIYVDAIRSGQVPCLENAVEALAQIENSAAVEKSHALYWQLMEERVKLSIETQEELSNVHKECKKEALQLFIGHCFMDNDQHYQNKLKEQKQIFERQAEMQKEVLNRAVKKKKNCVII